MNLRSCRKAKQLTQQKLCDKIGVARSTVGMWETGKSLPRTDMIPKLADTLGCSIDDLFGDLVGTKDTKAV